MTITPVEETEFERIVEVWEASVRASHNFLTDEDIGYLRPLVRRHALPGVVLRCARGDDGEIVGFLGVDGDKVEMLFVAPEHFGRGIGRALMQYAADEFEARRVDVNEQNPMARAFYEHLGYVVVDRSPLDGQGRPFPILHMEINDERTR